MATIFKRKNKDGSVTWRVMIRRVGLKPFITSFIYKKDAVKFVEENEAKYVLNPEKFTFDHLKRRRENEFFRRNE